MDRADPEITWNDEIIGKFFDENLLFKSNGISEGRLHGFESQAERIKRKIGEFVSRRFSHFFGKIVVRLCLNLLILDLWPICLPFFGHTSSA